jgi:putative acetyltransferase
VSRTAQPFFEHWGFKVIEERRPIMKGVVIPNALMKKEL